MMGSMETIATAWQTLHSSLHPIQNEHEYESTLEFMHDLMKQYDTTREPFKGLWDLAAGYVQTWEQANDPWLKDPPTGRDALAYLMRERGVTQYQLAKAGVAHQSTLSSILRGQRGISVGVARKLASFFGVPVDLFL
jgi:antitoxin component HigA of HigAB toxin-antitoxin module